MQYKEGRVDVEAESNVRPTHSPKEDQGSLREALAPADPKQHKGKGFCQLCSLGASKVPGTK